MRISTHLGQFGLYALEPYDLIRSKLERNITKDGDDVEFLAKAFDM